MASALGCVFVALLVGCCSGTQPLYFLSLLPYPGQPSPSETDGPALLAAGELALSTINSRPDILPGYHVSLINASTGCNIVNTALLGFLDGLFYSGVRVAAIVGPACSTSAELLLPLVNQPQTSLVSVHLASSPLLADRVQFRYSYSALDSCELFLSALLALVDEADWRGISVLYDDTRSFFTCIVSGLVRELSPDISTAPINDIITTGSAGALELPQNRVVFMLIGSDLFSSLVCSTYHRQMFYPSFQYVLVDRNESELEPGSYEIDGELTNCTREQLLKVLDLAIFINDRLTPLDPSAPTVAGKSAAELKRDYLQAVANISAPSVFAPAYYDSVWAVALALNRSMPQVNLSTYSYGMEGATQVIQQQLGQLAFDGFSGRIAFDESTGFVKRLADICQLRDGSLTLVGFYNGTFNMNSTGEYIPTALTQRTASIELGVIYLVVAAILVALVVVCHVMTVLRSSHPSVKASSPHLLNFAYIGCYAFGVQFILLFVSQCFIVSPQVYCQLMASEKAIGALAISLIFATICARTFRVYRIFVHYMNPGRFIGDAYLFSFVLVVVGVEVVAILLIAFIDPVRPCLSEVTTDTEAYLNIHCNNIRDLFFLLYNGVLTLAGIVLASVSLKEVKQQDFKTTSILLLVYAEVLIGLPLMITYVVLAVKGADPDVQLGVLGLMYVALLALFLALLLAPPITPALKTDLQVCWDRLRGSHVRSKETTS